MWRPGNKKMEESKIHLAWQAKKRRKLKNSALGHCKKYTAWVSN